MSPVGDAEGHEHEPALRVRSYVLTGGRTRARTDLPFETLVRVTDRGRALAPGLALERKDIVARCASPLSIAEISAHLQIPLGVARVIVGDMTDEGLLTASAPQLTGSGDRPDLSLLERVLDGLQAL
jgi:hypothetical protein